MPKSSAASLVEAATLLVGKVKDPLDPRTNLRLLRLHAAAASSSREDDSLSLTTPPPSVCVRVNLNHICAFGD